jgi:hypothetical protein
MSETVANRARNGYTFAPTPGKGPTMTAQRCHSIRPSREALAERWRVRGVRSTRWPSTRALLAALLIACGVAMLAGAAPASASGLPPVPSCFYKAGYCEGVLINPAVAPTKETDDKHGIFMLNASPLPTCISQRSQQVTGPSNRIKSTVFEAPSGLLSQSFCKGNYKATVLSGGTTLATEPFAIP